MAQDPRTLLQQAEKTVASASGGFSLFGGKQDKLERGADLFMQAGNAFRVQNLGREAGQAFEKAAAVQRQINEPDEAANTLLEAFKAYKKTDPADAARVLDAAINHYTLKGQFRRAATNKQNLAELYELELGDQKKAMEAYEVAAGWFEGDNAEALANKNFLKAADIAGLEEEYPRAVAHFEKVARSSANSAVMRWSIKDYFLKAGICHLAMKDTVGTSRAFDSYREIDPSFASTREHQLLIDLQQAMEQEDQEMFTDKLFQFDQLSKLDKWKTTLLLRLKNGIEEQGEDFS